MARRGCDVKRKALPDSGFRAVGVRRFDAPIHLGASPRSAAESSAQIGPVSRFVHEMGPEHLSVIVDAVERAFAAVAAPESAVVASNALPHTSQVTGSGASSTATSPTATRASPGSRCWPP